MTDPATEKFKARYGWRQPSETDVGLDVEFHYVFEGAEYPEVVRARFQAYGGPVGFTAVIVGHSERTMFDINRVSQFHESQVGPDGKHFSGGEILQTVMAGPYTLVEHQRTQADNVADENFEPHTMWSTFYEGERQAYVYPSLDRALIGAVARANDGSGTRADHYFAKMIGLD